jgi:hypothetical protein
MEGASPSPGPVMMTMTVEMEVTKKIVLPEHVVKQTSSVHQGPNVYHNVGNATVTRTVMTDLTRI